MLCLFVAAVTVLNSCLAGAATLNLPSWSNECIDPATASLNPNVYPSTFQIQSSTPAVIDTGYTQVKVAQNFEVRYFPSFKVVNFTVYGSSETYVLHTCGLPAPSAAALAAAAVPSSAKVFQVPLRSLAVADTTVLPFLEFLGVLDRVTLAPANSVNPCMQKLLAAPCGRVYNSSALPDSSTVDARVDGFPEPWNAPDALAPRTLFFPASADPGVLNRAEYIKYIATFFNLERVANAKFAQVRSQYNSLKSAAAQAVQGKTGSLVAWVAYWTSYEYPKGVVYPERVVLYNSVYRRDYVMDAGARMLNTSAAYEQLKAGPLSSSFAIDTQGNLNVYNLTLAAPLVRSLLRGVDVLVDETQYRNPDGSVVMDQNLLLTQQFMPRFGFNVSDLSNADFPFLVQGKLLRPLDGVRNAAGDTAWFEDAVARPDLVLQDMIYFLTPAALLTAAPNAKPVLVKSMLALPLSDRTLTLGAADCSVALQSCSLPRSTLCPAVFRQCNGTLGYSVTDTTPCATSCPLPTSPSASQSGAAGSLRLTSLYVVLLALLGSLALLQAV